MYYDEAVSEILQRSSFELIGDIIVYGEKTGIHAYNVSNGKRADIIVDSGTVIAVAGDYVYYQYIERSGSDSLIRDFYRVKTDGTGWEFVGDK